MYPGTKALFFKDKETAKENMEADSGISDYNHEEWQNITKDGCKPGIATKIYKHKIKGLPTKTPNTV